jgi:hypothetical protein
VTAIDMVSPPARVAVTRDFPIRPGRGELILRDVAREHRTTVAELRSHIKPAYLVRARIEAARRLTDLGYSRVLVGRIMRRDHTTVCWYLGTAHRHRAPKAAQVNGR